MPVKRKNISKKKRFEIFKRDSFKCQYCGAKSPEAILHVDHIIPVSKGGGDNSLNLITACQECNLGKGSDNLSPSSTVEKQRMAIEEMQDRREQISMMAAWYKEISEQEDIETRHACDLFYDLVLHQYSVGQVGMSKIKNCIQRFGFQNTMKAIQISCNLYLKYRSDNKTITYESVNIALEKVGGICFNRKKRGEE